MIPAPSRVEAGVAALRAHLENDVPLEDIVVAIWREMRSVKIRPGRPSFDERRFVEAVEAVRNGESLRSVRLRLGFGSTVASRIKEALRDGD